MSKKTCKLYRSIEDVLNPSISRKNISEYKIILKDDLVPIQVYYPNINVELNKVSIYIHGREICNDFYEEYALKTNNIVIVIDYTKDNYISELENIINYILGELIKSKIKYEDITLVGDFTGADIILELSSILDKKKYDKIDKILISPIENDLSNYIFSNTLVLSNNEEQISSEKIEYNLIKESLYDFIHDMDIVTNEKIYKYILDFIER